MKIKERALSVLLSLVMVLTFMPMLTFAEEGNAFADDDSTPAVEESTNEETVIEEPVAEEPAEETIVEEPAKGDPVDEQSYFVDFPNVSVSLNKPDGMTFTWNADNSEFNIKDGDVVVVSYNNKSDVLSFDYYDSEDEVYVFEGEDNAWVRVFFDEAKSLAFVYGRKSAGDPENWNHYVYDFNEYYIPVAIETSVQSISFEPSDIRVLAEDVKDSTEDGDDYYDFWNRSTHNMSGSSWKSPFAVGDALTVNYKDGTSEIYINQDYYDEEEQEYDDMFFCGDESIWPSIGDDSLVPGNNMITIGYKGVTTTINVCMIMDGGQDLPYIVDYEDASVHLEKADGQALTWDADSSEFNIHEGDSLIVTYNNTEDVLLFSHHDSDDVFYAFEGDDGTLAHVFFDEEEASAAVWVSKSAGDPDNWNHYIYNFDGYCIPTEINTSVQSISFEPSNITVNSEDVKNTEEDADYEYDFWNRTTHNQDGYSWKSPFAVGETLTVNYKDGTSEVYVNQDYYDEEEQTWDDMFFCGEESIWPVLDYNSLELGDNEVTIRYKGASTTINVCMIMDGEAGDEETLVYQATYFGNPSFDVDEFSNGIIFPYADETEYLDYIQVTTTEGEVFICNFANDSSSEEGNIKLYDEDGDEIYYYVYIEDTTASIYLSQYIPEEEVEWEATIEINNADINNDVERIAFKPSTIKLYSEDIKRTTTEGYTYYALRKRSIHSHSDETWESEFALGDQVVVYYDNGRTKTFTNKDFFDYEEREWIDGFINDNNENIYVEISNDGSQNIYDELKAGNNKVKVYYHGRTTTIDVEVETPESRAAEAAARAAEEAAAVQASAARAAAAAEAARQGTPGSLPGVKASKPKAAKKAITVKWKKLNKKQLKSGVSNIEVWVCSDGAFANGSTIEKVVGKKKSSVKIKGLQKGVTYYAKVRAITYSGGAKIVGPWSAVKTVKVKK